MICNGVSVCYCYIFILNNNWRLGCAYILNGKKLLCITSHSSYHHIPTVFWSEDVSKYKREGNTPEDFYNLELRYNFLAFSNTIKAIKYINMWLFLYCN